MRSQLFDFVDILQGTEGFTVKDAVSSQYQSYVAHWQRHKTEMRWRLKQHHEEGLKVAKTLADILKSDFGATKVALFGSMLCVNDIHMSSDIDIAVWGLPFDQYIAAMARLVNHAGELMWISCGLKQHRLA